MRVSTLQGIVLIVQVIVCFVAVNLAVAAISLLFPRAANILVIPDRKILRALRPPDAA